MDNKDPWVSYEKVSTSSDAFAYVQDIGNDLSDSLEHLNQGSPVRAKGLPTEKYTAGNTNDVMEGVHEESFLTQTPSKISRRYSPMTKSEYSGYRPPDPVFLSYNNSQTSNTFLPEPLAKHKTIEDIDKVQINNKFVVNKLNSVKREAAIAPEALELINILNPIEAREIQNNSSTTDVRVEKYTSSTPPIEIKKTETKIKTVFSQNNVSSIIVGKPKTLNTFNQNTNNNNQVNQNNQSNISSKTDVSVNEESIVNNINNTTDLWNVNQVNQNNQSDSFNNIANVEEQTLATNSNNFNSTSSLTENFNNTSTTEINNEQAGPTYVQNTGSTINITSSNQKIIEIKKPSVSPKISQYTNTINFDSFVSSTFAEIVDQKAEQKILSRNNINVRKLVTDVNNFLTQNKSEFKTSVSQSVEQFFSTYSENNLNNLKNSIQNVILNSNNVQDLNITVSRIVNEYFNKNENEVNQNIASEFINFFNQNLQSQITNFENKSSAELNVIQNVTNLISDIKNEYEAKQIEFQNIISQVTEDNVLNKVVELADLHQNYKQEVESYIENISAQINNLSLTEIKELHTQLLKNIEIKNQSVLNIYKQEMMGFAMTYLSSAFPQTIVQNFTNSLTSSNTTEDIRNIVNTFISNNKTDENMQTVNSMQYFANDKYANISSSLLIESIENNILNSLSNVIQNYTNVDSVQNSLVSQVKNELSQSITTEIQNKVNSFNFEEIKTSLQNVYVSQDVNEIKNEFENVLNENKTEANSQVISYLNNLLQSNLATYTTKSINVLNEPRYVNSVKRLVNENLHNVVANIVHNLSEVNTYSDDQNISTLVSNIRIINDRFLLNNSESRLQNFNLIQSSIDNFLTNTEANYINKVSKIKVNLDSYDSSLVENLNIFESVNSSSTNNQINQLRTLISQTDVNNLNQESKEFIQETKLYTDLINMKNQISSEIDNFVNNTFEAILAVNQSSTVISTQQIISLIEEAVSTFNSSSISNKSISHITNVMKDIKRPELFNNTFQVITSTNILEDQIKNYLLQNNSVLADFSLQQIMNTINQPIYSDYVTFQDIKEIINKTTSTSSFGILSEIKQYINQLNSEENIQFISNLKTYLIENETILTVENNTSFSEQLKNFIDEQSNYSAESFNQIINNVSNKFENKYATILNSLINENISTMNQFVETLYSDILNNESKETILSTLSTFINNNSYIFETNESTNVSNENTINQENNSSYNSSSSSLNNQNSLSVNTYQNSRTNLSFKFDQEFKNTIQNISSSSTKEEVITNLNIFKESIFNNTIATVNSAINHTDTRLENYNNIVNNNEYSFDEKIQNIIESINTSITNQNLSSQEIKNLELIKNYILNESFKIETVNKISSQDIFNVKNFDEYENAINTRIQQSVFSNSFIQTINKLRTEISNLNSKQEIKIYATEIKNNALNELKLLVSDFVSIVNPQYSNSETISILNSASSLEEVSNFVSESSTVLTESQNLTISTLLTQNNLINNIADSVINSVTNNNQADGTINVIQNVDNKVNEILKNQINYQNNLMIENIRTNLDKYDFTDNKSYEQIQNSISNMISNSISEQGFYFDSVLQSFNIKNIQEQILFSNQNVYERINNAVKNYDLSKLLTNTINENINLNQNIFNSEVIETLSNALQQTINISQKDTSIEEVLNTINSSNRQDFNIQNVVNTSSYEDNMNHSILETRNQNAYLMFDEKNNYQNSVSTSNHEIVETVKNSFNNTNIKDVYNQNIINELTSNSFKLRNLLEQKSSGNIENLNNQYINTFITKIDEAKEVVVNEVKNEVEKIENITLNFNNQNNYQRSSIQIYDEVVNKIEASLHPDFDKVSLNQPDNLYQITSTDNEFKNITVVKQIDENEDVQLSNLRIEKVWNKFIQQEVNKIVEEVNNISEFTSQENTYNQSNTSVNNSSNSESYNNSQYNFDQGNVNNTENKTIFNSYNNIQQGLQSTTKETEERINYKEITEIVFSKIEEKLKIHNVTTEDIIILKHKILNEVTEIYEKRSQIDIKKSEEKMKKEMQDLFIRFLNS